MEKSWECDLWSISMTRKMNILWSIWSMSKAWYSNPWLAGVLAELSNIYYPVMWLRERMRAGCLWGREIWTIILVTRWSRGLRTIVMGMAKTNEGTWFSAYSITHNHKLLKVTIDPSLKYPQKCTWGRMIDFLATSLEEILLILHLLVLQVVVEQLLPLLIKGRKLSH